MKSLRVVLADDHVMVAQALAEYLREHFTLLAVVSDGAQLMTEVRKLRPDVVVADLSMPIMNGLACTKLIREENLGCKVVILTMHMDAEFASVALRTGANGYVIKQAAGEELVAAIQEVMRGGVYLSKQIAAEAINALVSPSSRANRKITPRQQEIMKLVAVGRSVKEIAAMLNLSSRTVESHKYEMMDILGVTTTAELIAYAIKHAEVEGV